MCVKLHTVGWSGLEVSDLEDTGPRFKFPAIQWKLNKIRESSLLMTRLISSSAFNILSLKQILTDCS